MNQAWKAYVTNLPNLVTESQKYAKSGDFWGKSHIWSVVLQRNVLRVGWVFVKILKRKYEKDLQLVWGKVQYCLQKEVFFEVLKGTMIKKSLAFSLPILKAYSLNIQLAKFWTLSVSSGFPGPPLLTFKTVR